MGYFNQGNSSKINQLSSSLASIAYQSIKNFGAAADANYYNSSNGKYYKDSSFTQLATDNLTAFTNALNSGYNITIPTGNYYISSRITVTASVHIKGDNANIFFKSQALPDYGFYIKGDFTNVEGITVQSTLDQTPYISSVAQTGKTSNIAAFEIEANNVVINNCKTINCDRGVDKGTMVSCENLYITNCNFSDCAFGIFAFYITNMYVSNCFISCNNSGLAAGFHCIYLSDYATNVFIDDCKLLWKTDVDGALFQVYSGRSVQMKNIHVSDCEFETYGNHAFVLGFADGIYVKNCVFNMHQVFLTPGSKVMFSQGSLTNVRIEDCTFNMYRANFIIYGSNTDEIRLSHCTINIDDNVTNTVLGTNALLPQSFTRCTIRFKNFTSGQVIGGITNLKMINSYVTADAGKLTLGNGMITGQNVELINSTFLHRGSSSTGQVVYGWATGYALRIVSCKFYGFAAIGATDGGQASPNGVMLIDNLLAEPLNR